MILQTILLENFKSYGEAQTIDLLNVDATSISGPNGAGKSSIIEAITFSLYGRSTATERKELGNEALIRDGEKQARVAVTFEKDGNTYSVERTTTRQGQGTATLISGTAKALQAGTSNVSKMVEEIIGMDYETFVSSTIMRQDEMDKITSLRPGDRKEILSKIFGLEAYEKLKKTTHEKLLKAKADVEASDELIKQLSSAIASEEEASTGIEGAKASVKKLQAAITRNGETLEGLEKQIKAALAKKSEFDTARAGFEAFEREMRTSKARLENTQVEIKSTKDAQKQLGDLTKEIAKGKKVATERDEFLKIKDQLASNIAEKQERLRSIKLLIAEEDEHYKTIRNSKKAECPVCKRPLDQQHRTNVLTQYETRLKELRSGHEKFGAETRANTTKLEKEIVPHLDALQEQIESFQQLELRKARLEAEASRLPKLEETEKELRATLDKASKSKESTEAKLQKLKSAAEEYEKLDQEKSKVSETLAELREERGKADSTIKHLGQVLEQINTAKKELQRIKGEVGSKTETIPIYKILEEAFGKDGIPTAILRDLVPEVEDEASRILRELSNGRMNINFRFGRTTGRGTQTDELIIEAEDGTGKHPVTRFSGGERMRINLALRLGISEVIARRSGYKGKIETLIIDEGLGALDEEGRQATLEILRQLRQRFKKILVISHVDEVKDAFDTKLLISKTSAGQSIAEMA
ncbi:MAG: SMC family ATPase [Candidatus Bathyarchaeia archaeon]|jgi:exonuclease SbcC